MTWDQYWYGDVWMAGAFYKAERQRIERQNQYLWMQGLYFYEAMCAVSPVLHAFAKKGTKPARYRESPYPLFGEEQEQERAAEQEQAAENERLKAELFFKNWARAAAKKFDK